VSWFIFSTSSVILAYVIELVADGGGRCVSGNSPYVIKTYCPQAATVFLPWVILTALLAIAIGIVFAYGIGIQIFLWLAPILFGSLAALFFSGDDLEGILLGLMFVVFALVPLISELRGGIARMFVGSANIFGTPFVVHPSAKKTLTSRTTESPEGAIAPSARDWVISVAGFVVPVVLGYVVASLWIVAVVG
jgi:hypothetical protein